LRLRNIVVAGTLIRMVLMPFTAHPFDVDVWHQIILSITANPLSVAYFPPMLFYTFIPVAFAYNLVSNILGTSPIALSSLPGELNPDPRYGIHNITDPSFNMLVKVPFLVSDIVATILIFKLVDRLSEDKRKASWAAALWFLNPYLILISAVWGMFDSLPTLFSIASIWFLTQRRLDLSALSLAVAAVYKLYPMVFLMPTILFIRKFEPSSPRRTVLRYLAIFTAFLLILLLPAISKSLSFSQGLLGGPSDPGAGGFGLTFWSVLLMTPLDPSYVVVTSNLIVIVFLAVTYLQAARSKFNGGLLSLAAFQLCSIFSIFAGFRFVCEQFFVWALPYMVILGVVGKVKIKDYWVLSMIALAYSLIHGINAVFFFLPTWPWLGGILLSAVRLIRRPVAPGSGQGYEVVSQPHVSPITLTLTILGTAFTLLVIANWRRLIRDSTHSVGEGSESQRPGFLRP